MESDFLKARTVTLVLPFQDEKHLKKRAEEAADVALIQLKTV